MAPISSLQKNKEVIKSFFKKRNICVYTIPELSNLFNRERENWKIAKSTRLSAFLSFLMDEEIMERSTLEFPWRKYQLFSLPNCNPLTIIQKTEQSGYFSHYTAASIHELTKQSPKVFYFKLETQKQPQGGILAQNRIDAAFKSPPRVSNRVASFRNFSVNMLSGAITKNLGIEPLFIDAENPVRVTNIERTLIDIVIRPYYAGGVGEVLNMYKAAKDRFSTNKLKVMLKKLNLTYPYHQAIGFYLERSGVYSETQLAVFDSIPKEFDFYLTYQMKDLEYSVKWRLYYPKGL